MNFDNELLFAKQVAFKAGDMMLAGFSKASVSIKENLTPVTETDVAISNYVIAEIQKNFPTHAILDEEIYHDIPENDYVWVCDPIDGTIPFAHHIPTSMFSLALCYKKEPVVAVIYDPYMKRLLSTKTNSASMVNDKVISVAQGGFEKGEILYGLTHWNNNFDQNAFLRALFERHITVTSVESIVYQAMLVALGLTKAMVTVAANPWDRAAAILIIEHAGGICTDEKGDRLTVFGDPKLFIATNKSVHKTVLEIVQPCIQV